MRLGAIEHAPISIDRSIETHEWPQLTDDAQGMKRVPGLGISLSISHLRDESIIRSKSIGHFPNRKQPIEGTRVVIPSDLFRIARQKTPVPFLCQLGPAWRPRRADEQLTCDTVA